MLHHPRDGRTRSLRAPVAEEQGQLVYDRPVTAAVLRKVLREELHPQPHLVAGQRVVGFDNERGKGDHRHVAGEERTCRFTDVPTLLADFMADVEGAT